MSDSEKENMEKVEGRRESETRPMTATLTAKTDGRQHKPLPLPLSRPIFSSFDFAIGFVLKGK